MNPGVGTVYRWELFKLRYQKRTYLGLGAAGSCRSYSWSRSTSGVAIAAGLPFSCVPDQSGWRSRW